MIEKMDDLLRVYSVSELTDEIKEHLEERFGWVEVRGEVSQPKISRNGHLYFTLKDSGAQLSCVMWGSRQRENDYQPAHGDEVLVSGSLQLYAPYGRYQLIAESIQAAGEGALQRAFEELKSKLMSEGLFEARRKRQLPEFPRVIGIVTSATGSVFQDMRDTLARRYPLASVKLFHAAVQGRQAAPEICEGIRYLSEEVGVDVVIVGRGGGSLEDLWAFNEEMVAREMASCGVPVISAVGHETDFTIADFVADVRAATPTQAIILAVPDQNDLRMKIDEMALMIENRVLRLMDEHKNKISRFLENYALHQIKERLLRYREMVSWQLNKIIYLADNRIERKREGVRRMEAEIKNIVSHLLNEKKGNWREMHHRLPVLDPDAALKKGYSRIWQQGKWIRSIEHFSAGSRFEIEWNKGRQEINKKNAC